MRKTLRKHERKARNASRRARALRYSNTVAEYPSLNGTAGAYPEWWRSEPIGIRKYASRWTGAEDKPRVKRAPRATPPPRGDGFDAIDDATRQAIERAMAVSSTSWGIRD